MKLTIAVAVAFASYLPLAWAEDPKPPFSVELSFSFSSPTETAQKSGHVLGHVAVFENLKATNYSDAIREAGLLIGTKYKKGVEADVPCNKAQKGKETDADTLSDPRVRAYLAEAARRDPEAGLCRKTITAAKIVGAVLQHTDASGPDWASYSSLCKVGDSLDSGMTLCPGAVAPSSGGGDVVSGIKWIIRRLKGRKRSQEVNQPIDTSATANPAQ